MRTPRCNAVAPVRTRHHPTRRAAGLYGFSLVEVMVAVLISSTGILGLLGMQSIAARNMQSARTRSVVALQATSLAAAMHSNTAYWAFAVAPANFSMSGTSISEAGNRLNRPDINCISDLSSPTGSCTPEDLATFDLATWTKSMNQLVPGYLANSVCGIDDTRPFSCSLTISWNERFARNTTTVDSLATSGQQSFTLYIQP